MSPERTLGQGLEVSGLGLGCLGMNSTLRIAAGDASEGSHCAVDDARDFAELRRGLDDLVNRFARRDVDRQSTTARRRASTTASATGPDEDIARLAQLDCESRVRTQQEKRDAS